MIKKGPFWVAPMLDEQTSQPDLVGLAEPRPFEHFAEDSDHLIPQRLSHKGNCDRFDIRR